MSDTVIVFGAGASAECGAPTMATFLDVARDIYFRGTAGSATESFRRVFKGIAALNDVYAKANIDTDNLEAVFAAFEMAQLFGRLPRLDDPAELSALSDSLRNVIVETLEQTVSLHISNRSVSPAGRRVSDVDQPRAYGELLSLLASHDPRLERPTLITFNYDLALDYALCCCSGVAGIDYGLKPERVPGLALLLKLHGSVNWTACRNCGVAVYDLHANTSRDRREIRPPLVENGDDVHFRVAERLLTLEHCNAKDQDAGVPLLVPPTWSKGEYHRQLAVVWQHAARELATARNIIVIGYSLPETDQFFHYLYALGTVGDTRLERLWVINKDESETVKTSFQELLGKTALARFEYIPLTFEHAISPLHFSHDQHRWSGKLRGFFQSVGKS